MTTSRRITSHFNLVCPPHLARYVDENLLVVAVGKTISHEFTTAATLNYTVTLTVTDNDGATASTSLVITTFVPEEIPDDPPAANFIVTERTLAV